MRRGLSRLRIFPSGHRLIEPAEEKFIWLGRRYWALVSIRIVPKECEMDNQFEWLEVKTVYRETRQTKHGEELRWLVNREKILNKATGKTTTRGMIRHPGICVIAPFVDDDHIALMRQYRYAAEGELWELQIGRAHVCTTVTDPSRMP